MTEDELLQELQRLRNELEEFMIKNAELRGLLKDREEEIEELNGIIADWNKRDRRKP